MTTKCLLVCENDFLVAGVKALLADQSGLEINTVGAKSAMEVLQSIETLHPDVAILDEGLHPLSPTQLRELRRRLPNLRLIVLNHLDNVLRVFQGSWSAESHVRDLGKVITNHIPHS